MRPTFGFTKPSSALSIVLLPAPLGPRSPTAPRANLALTSLRAWFAPYSTVTPSSSTTGSVAGEAGRISAGAEVCI